MRPRTLYLLAAALSFLISLVLLAPAALLYGWFKPGADGAVALAGVDGTLREGRVAAVLVGGRPLVDDLHWRLTLRELLLGRIGADLGSDGATVLDGHLSKGLFGALRARDLRVAASLKSLMVAFGQPFAPVDGQAQLDLPQLTLVRYWPVKAQGTLRVQGLAWTLTREPLLLGDYQTDIVTDGDDIVAQIHTLGGSLDVNGAARAKPDRSYELHLQLKPKIDAPPLILNLLRTLGSPDPQGYYHLQRTGGPA